MGWSLPGVELGGSDTAPNVLAMEEDGVLRGDSSGDGVGSSEELRWLVKGKRVNFSRLLP